MLSFFSSRQNWDSPTPLAAGECTPPPLFGPGVGVGHTRLRERGWGSPNSDEGTYGTPTKRQVSKRQVSKRLVSKRPVSKRQVYKTSGLQNVRFQNVWFQNVQFLNLIYLLYKKYLYLSFLLITSHYGDI